MGCGGNLGLPKIFLGTMSSQQESKLRPSIVKLVPRAMRSSPCRSPANQDLCWQNERVDGLFIRIVEWLGLTDSYSDEMIREERTNVTCARMEFRQ